MTTSGSKRKTLELVPNIEEETLPVRPVEKPKSPQQHREYHSDYNGIPVKFSHAQNWEQILDELARLNDELCRTHKGGISPDFTVETIRQIALESLGADCGCPDSRGKKAYECPVCTNEAQKELDNWWKEVSDLVPTAMRLAKEEIKNSDVQAILESIKREKAAPAQLHPTVELDSSPNGSEGFLAAKIRKLRNLIK